MRVLESSLRVKRVSSRAMLTVGIFIAALIVLCLSLSGAQEGKIARGLANPFSSLWNIVNQIIFNDLKGGQFKESHTQFNWNLQPVTPIPFNDQFNIINRPVFPYYSSPYVDLTGAVSYGSGLGDIQLATLIAANKSEGIIYGLGLAFTPVIPSPFAKKE